MNKFRILEILFETPDPDGKRYFVRSAQDYCTIITNWFSSTKPIKVDELIEMEGGYNDPKNAILNELTLKWVDYPFNVQWVLNVDQPVGIEYKNKRISRFINRNVS